MNFTSPVGRIFFKKKRRKLHACHIEERINFFFPLFLPLNWQQYEYVI